MPELQVMKLSLLGCSFYREWGRIPSYVGEIRVGGEGGGVPSFSWGERMSVLNGSLVLWHLANIQGVMRGMCIVVSLEQF